MAFKNGDKWGKNLMSKTVGIIGAIVTLFVMQYFTYKGLDAVLPLRRLT